MQNLGKIHDHCGNIFLLSLVAEVWLHFHPASGMPPAARPALCHVMACDMAGEVEWDSMDGDEAAGEWSVVIHHGSALR